MRTAASLIDPVSETTTGGEVYDRFHAEPETLAIAVVDADLRPIGLVERHTFFLRMAAEFGRALFGKRPITALMDEAPLIVEATTPVSGFLAHAVKTSASALLGGFIVTDNGRYLGVGAPLNLLLAANDENQRRAAEMEALVQSYRLLLDDNAEARDAAQAANRAKSEFLANMSHEIRTPLNGVLGIAHSLGRTELSPHQKAMIRLIEGSAETLQVLLSDILDLARVEAGRMEIAAAPFAIDEAVREIAELFRAKADEKDLAFDIDCAALAGVCVVGDRTRIKQVLGNLVSNAVKFTAQGRVQLTATSRPGADGELQLVFDVADTGIGFDEETRLRLFNRFEQADGSGVRKFGGAGLGLAISRTLAIAMGGDLTARSTPGAGSTFTLDLCLPIAEHQSAPVKTAVPETFERPLRILLAEDHPINRKVVELMFDGLSVELVCAEDGALALDIFRTQLFDVVLMDMQMPNMDGLQATRAIRALERDKGQQATPVIMLSANALPEHKAAGHAAGANLYLTKPIIAAALFAAIDEALCDLDAQAAA